MQQQQFGRRSCSTDAQAESLVPRSCALFQGVDEAGPGAFSIFFATAVMNEQQLPEDCDPSCESSAVDCTLSLATPSTRGYQSRPTSKPSPLPAVIQQRHAGYPLRFDFLRTNQEPKQIPPAAAGTGGTTVLKVSGDPVPLPRRCASCDTTSTPLWRNGPRGPKSLCNACGIRYKKEERRAASSAAAHSSTSSSSSSSSASSAAAHLEAPASQQQLHPTMGYGGYHHRWGCPGSRLAEARKCPPSPLLSAVTLGDNVDAMEGAALPYVPWHRFNVAVPPQGAEFATSRFHDCSLH